MNSYALGMMVSSLIEHENSKNNTFHDHRAILLDLSNSLLKVYKKENFRDILCDLYNNDLNDCTTLAIKRYLKTKDEFESPNKDMNTNDAEVLIRCIPLAFYLSYCLFLLTYVLYER